MSRVCQLTGKRPLVGNNVSHSNVKTKRTFVPNVHRKRYYIPELDSWVSLKLTTQAMRTIDKLGLYSYLKKLERKGINTGVKL